MGGNIGTTAALVSTTVVTNLSGLKQRSSINQNSVHSMAQLVPFSRFHRSEIEVLLGLPPLLEALGNESSSRLI